MELVKTDRLCDLGGRFDVFESTPRLDPQLLRLGFQRPLPIWRDELVWGFSILRSARDESILEFPTITVDGTACEMIDLALSLENRRDAYTLAEKASLLRLFEVYAIDPVPSEILTKVQSSGSFERQARRFTELPPAQRRLVESGRLDLKTAGRLSRLSDAAWAVVEDTHRLTASETRLFSTHVDEIARRDELSSEECDALVVRMCSADSPLEESSRSRYPVLDETNSNFDRIVDSALSGSGVHLEAPRYFEGDSYRISCVFASCKELEKRIRSLERLKEACDGLFELL